MKYINENKNIGGSFTIKTNFYQWVATVILKIIEFLDKSLYWLKTNL